MAQKSVEKWKMKKWYNVYAPKLFGDLSIGEIPADDEKNVVGRLIKVSMSWITHKPEHSFITVGLRIVNVNGDIANTRIDYLEQTYSYIHSLVKRHSSAIYTVNRLKDKDGKDFTLKLVIITLSPAGTPKIKAIRKVVGEFAESYAVSHNVEELMRSILGNEFQIQTVGKLQNIAQVNKLEVKKIEL